MKVSKDGNTWHWVGCGSVFDANTDKNSRVRTISRSLRCLKGSLGCLKGSLECLEGCLRCLEGSLGCLEGSVPGVDVEGDAGEEDMAESVCVCMCVCVRVSTWHWVECGSVFDANTDKNSRVCATSKTRNDIRLTLNPRVGLRVKA